MSDQPSVSLQRGVYVGEKRDHVNEAGYLEQIENARFGAGNTEIGARLCGLSITIGNDADAGAVDVADPGKIQDHHPGAFLDGADDLRFNMVALSTERNTSAEFNDGDAIVQLPLFDLENHCTQDTASDEALQAPAFPHVSVELTDSSEPHIFVETYGFLIG
jgi:hypothetical protein